MSENRCSCNGTSASPGTRDTVCIDTYRVLDSCRDRDCFENARVYLDTTGQEIINSTGVGGVRTTSTKLLWTQISLDPIQFNNGFYQITARFYVLVKCEMCLGLGRAQEFNGISVVEKRVVLYGGEGTASIFRSDGDTSACVPFSGTRTSNAPVAAVEVVDPVVLGTTIVEPSETCTCYCCCGSNDIPNEILEQNGIVGQLCDTTTGNRLYVSLGLFTVFRIERPAQYLITASDYSVPDKECTSSEPSNPCSLFQSMAFPTNEFSGGGTTTATTRTCGNSNDCGCGRR